jgi:hypothetical protein
MDVSWIHRGPAVWRIVASATAAVETPNGTSLTWRGIIGADRSAATGWSFLAGSQDLEVDALGIFDQDGDGLEDAHPTGIWTSGGTLLAQVTVSPGTGGNLVASYRYASLAPLTLAAGQTYVLGAYFGPVVDRCGSACGDAQLVFGTETFAPRHHIRAVPAEPIHNWCRISRVSGS